MNEHSHSCTGHGCLYQSTLQGLDEMDFERGIWGAASCGDINRVQKLLDKYADVNRPDKYGYTALHYAVRNNHEDICDLLIKVGADIFAKTKGYGATPAHRAAYTGRLNVLQLLVRKGGVALLESCDNEGRNCLHYAYRGKQEDVICWILENYPHLANITDSKGLLPISLSPD